MATYCFNLAAILTVNVMHSSSRVITRDQQAKIAEIDRARLTDYRATNYQCRQV